MAEAPEGAGVVGQAAPLGAKGEPQGCSLRLIPVARVDDLPPGGRRVIEIEGRSIGVFNVGGRFVAVRNACPHQGAPVCLGRVGGTTLPSEPGTYRWGREGEILACPWHGWEFDLLTGRALADASVRLRPYDVTVQDGSVYVRW